MNGRDRTAEGAHSDAAELDAGERAGKSTRVEALKRGATRGVDSPSAAPPSPARIEDGLAAFVRDEGLRLIGAEPAALAELREAMSDGAPPSLAPGSALVQALAYVEARFPRVGQSFVERWRRVLAIVDAAAAPDEVARWVGAPSGDPRDEHDGERPINPRRGRLVNLAAELQPKPPSGRDAVLAELAAVPVASLRSAERRQRAVDTLLDELREVEPAALERTRELLAPEGALAELRALVAAWSQRWSETPFVERAVELAQQLDDSERAAAGAGEVRAAVDASREAERLRRVLGLPAPDEPSMQSNEFEVRQIAALLDGELRRLAALAPAQRDGRIMLGLVRQAQREAERERALSEERNSPLAKVAPPADEALRATVARLAEAPTLRSLLSPIAAAIEQGERVSEETLPAGRAAADPEELLRGIDAMPDGALVREWSHFDELLRLPAAERATAAERFVLELRPERKEELEGALPGGRADPVKARLRERLPAAAAREPALDEVARRLDGKRGKMPQRESEKGGKDLQPAELRTMTRVRLRVPGRAPHLHRALADWARRRPSSILDENAGLLAVTPEERAQLEAELSEALRIDRPPGGGERAPQPELLQDAVDD